MGTTDDMPLSAEDDASRLAFETLISDLSSRFINLPSGEVDREIEDGLRRICEVLDLDLAALWERPKATEGPFVLTHFHSFREDLRPPMLGMSAEEYVPWHQQEILAIRSVAVSSLDDLPAAAALDRESMRLFGVESGLTVPLAVGGESPVGAVSFNTMTAGRVWPDSLADRLRLVAQIFAGALARKRADEALKESEERLAMAADAAEVGLWSLDYRTRVHWASDRARAIFGFSPDEVVTVEAFEATVHPEDRALVREAIERSFRSAEEAVSLEYRLLTATGVARWISTRGRGRLKPTGEPDRLTGVSIDITERRREHEELRESKARLEAGVLLAGLAFYELDFDDETAYVDERFRDLCGVPSSLKEGLQAFDFWREHVHPDDRARVTDQRMALYDGGLEELSLEYRYLHPTEGQKWIRHLARVATRDGVGRRIRVYGVLRDVSERKCAEEALHDLSRRLIGAHEEERALLARELHDDVTQRLAVLAIDVGQAELAAQDSAQAEAMQAVRAGLVDLSEDIHSLAYQLHPSILEELGLAEALQAECERRERQGRLDVSMDLDPLPSGVGADAALCLFRVAQEALNNVARHAGVRGVEVTLRHMDDGLLLAVSDAGAGFDPEGRKEGMHLGLASMRERVRLARGTLDIESAPGEGTTILAWVPAEGASS